MLFRIRVQPASLKYVNSSLSRASSAANQILPVSRSISIPISRSLPDRHLRLRGNVQTRSYSDNGTSKSPSSSPSSLPIDPSSPHNDLQTFLEHASQSSLSRTSTTYLGTRYEYLTQQHLSTHLNFELTRTGGRGDSGIDLLGTWPLPSIQCGDHTCPSALSPSVPQPSDAIRVIIQCKRLSRVTGPSLMRELEGSFRGAPSGWRGPNVLGVMVCSRGATKGIRDAMARSQRGLVWIYLEEVENVEDQSVTREGQHENLDVEGQIPSGIDKARRDISPPPSNTGREEDTSSSSSDRKIHRGIPKTYMRQFLYNAAAASECGLQGIDVGLKYNSNVTSTDAGTSTNAQADKEPEVQLLWRGKPLDFGRVPGRA